MGQNSSKNSIRNFIFLPAPDPLGSLVVSKAHDIDSLNDNSRTRGDTVYVNDPTTGQYEPFTNLKARPTQSDGGIAAPIQTAANLQSLATLYPDCPIPLQIRSYLCDNPGSQPDNWTEIIHLDHVLFGQESFTNLTAQGIDQDDNTPLVTIQFVYDRKRTVTQATPGYYTWDGTTGDHTQSLTYHGSPGCGDCEGQPKAGCETLYAGKTDGIIYSNDGGATWATLTTGVAISTHCYLVSHAGRLIFAHSNEIYYSDDPQGGAAAWQQATLPITPTTVRRLASNGTYVYAQYNGSGIMRSRDNGSTWEIVASAGDLTSETIRCLSADGSVIMAGHDNQAITYSTDDGDVGSWTLIAGPGAATDDYFGGAVAQWSDRNRAAVVMFIVNDDGTDRVLYRSEDYGTTWAEKLTLAGATGSNEAWVRTALHGWIVWLTNAGETYMSVGGGDTFLDVSNSSYVAGGNDAFAVCPHDLSKLFIVNNDQTP